MTSLLIWFAADNKAKPNFVPASVYIASDSRITWNDGKDKCDSAKKVFASVTYPEIFGFCGDSRFASNVLSQALGAIDSGYLFAPGEDVQTKLTRIEQLFSVTWKAFPEQQLTHNTSIVHISREGEGVKSKFC